MKRLSFLCFSLLASQSNYCQGQLLKQGVLKPINGKPIVIIPSTKNEPYTTIVNGVSSQKNIATNGGTFNLLSGNTEPNYNNDNSLTSLTGNYATTNISNEKNSLNQSTSLNNELAPLITNTSVTNNNAQQNINAPNKIVNKPLEPLTYTPLNAPVKNITESVDPSRITKDVYSASSVNKPTYNSSLIKNKTETVGPRTISNNNSLAMIDLAPISSSEIKVKDKSGMPELAPIPYASKPNNTSIMPELAPIVGIEIKSDEKKSSNIMPDLAPIEDNSNINKTGENINSKNDGKPRGFILPTGTLFKATDSKTYIIKPISSQTDIEKDETNQQSYKPSAGGGMGLVLEENLSDIMVTQNTNPIQPTKQQLELAAKQHKHDPNNPCCKVQMYNASSPKKIIKKRKYTTKKIAPVLYTYKQDPAQTKNIERIVYVPVQPNQQYQQPKQETYSNKPTETLTQVNPPKEKVVYRDYTNTYTKQTVSNNSNNCVCPGNNTQQKNNVNDPKAYYNASNYANGLNAGPTSGDYPMNNKSSEADMKYTFYVNPRGKYGVSLYNSFCSVLLLQNGKVVEFKEYGDPNQPKPKLNYFGSPESIGGIPIEYNYNRSVHKIGNIVLDYDFEGFFKTVGSSNVFYTSRSSLSKVDNVNVRYDGMGNVTSVDQNDGLIKYNP